MIEIERIKQEQVIQKEADFEVLGPFNKDDIEMQGGRPPDTKDADRKTRKAKPKTTAVFAMEALSAVDKYITPVYMAKNNIKNARQLTQPHRDELDVMKTMVFACIKLGDELSEAHILKLAEEAQKADKVVISKIESNISDFTNERGEKPNKEQRKMLEALGWAEAIKGE